MPRDSKPWFRKDRDAWFVTINGRRYNLGPDRAAAHDRFHELMLTGGDENNSNGAISVVQLFDDFLEWTKAQRAPVRIRVGVADSQLAAYIQQGSAPRQPASAVRALSQSLELENVRLWMELGSPTVLDRNRHRN